MWGLGFLSGGGGWLWDSVDVDGVEVWGLGFKFNNLLGSKSRVWGLGFCSRFRLQGLGSTGVPHSQETDSPPRATLGP